MRNERGSLPVKAGAVTAGLAAIFFVPYLFPHPDGHSQSYLAHYSNRVALLLLLGCTAALAWATDGLGLRFGQEGREAGSRWPMLGAMGLSVVLVGALWWLSLRLGAVYETGYFLDRYSMRALGERLYGQVEFPYGPLMFYPQVGLARVTGLAVGNAHFIILMAHWIAGMGLLWVVCRRLAGERRVLLALFFLLGAFWLGTTVDGAMNYTPLRFLLGPAIALAVFDTWTKGWQPLRVFGLALAGFWMLLFLSPEQGIAFGLGTLLYFGVLVRTRAMAAALGTFAAGCAVGLWVAYRMEVLSSMLSFGGGALDFPLLPAVGTVVMLVALMVGGAVVLAAVGRGEWRRPEVYLGVMTAFLLPAAFGRCDPGHILINTMPVVAIGFCALARVRSGYAWACGALGVFVLFGEARQWVQFARMERVAWHAEHSSAGQLWPPGERLLAPFGFRQRLDAKVPLPVLTGKYASYRPLNDDVPRDRVAMLAQEPGTAVLVPLNSVILCSSSEELRVAELKIVFRPFWIPPARAVDESPKMLCDYLAVNYVRGGYGLVGGEEVWLRRR